MFHIIRTEWLKIKKYPAFWWVMGITALTYPGINYMFINEYKNIVAKKDASGQVVKALMGDPFMFPEGWHTVAFFSSFFIFIPAIVVIMLITNEYSYKTNRQNIIDGWSRRDFIVGKLIDVIIMSALVTLLYLIVALIIGIVSTSDPGVSYWSMSYYVGLFALQTFAQLSFAFLVGLIVKRSLIALASFTFYFLIAEPMATGLLEFKLHSKLGRFLPLEVSDRLIPRPAFLSKFNEAAYKEALDGIKYHVFYTIIFLVLLWSFCFWLNKRRDL